MATWIILQIMSGRHCKSKLGTIFNWSDIRSSNIYTETDHVKVVGEVPKALYVAVFIQVKYGLCEKNFLTDLKLISLQCETSIFQRRANIKDPQ